jgi:hypothetical protein
VSGKTHAKRCIERHYIKVLAGGTLGGLMKMPGGFAGLMRLDHLSRTRIDISTTYCFLQKALVCV